MKLATFSGELLVRIRHAKAGIQIDPQRRDTLVANLVFLHDAVVASEQLLIEAAQWSDQLSRTPFQIRLSEYYRSHLEEERDHLKWLRQDLESAGVAIGTPNPVAMAMVGTQYYLLKHIHPCTLLGYMAIVEGDPVPLEAVDLLERTHGKDLLRFVRFHAVKDLEHRIELFELIDQTPKSLQGSISESAENVLTHLRQAVHYWG
jgi:hypothetical protein